MDRRASMRLTRRDISEYTGVADGVLSFWIRNGLLSARAGGRGKGSHREFDQIQLSLAAVLVSLQDYGMNIAVLRSFADFFQRGVMLCEGAASGTGLTPAGLAVASEVAAQLDPFRSLPERAEDDDGADRYPSGEKGVEQIALTLKQATDDPKEDVLAFASTLTNDDRMAVLLYALVKQAQDDAQPDLVLLIWRAFSGAWRVAALREAAIASVIPPPVKTAIVLRLTQIAHRASAMGETGSQS